MVRLLGCGAPRPARPPMERLHAAQAVVRRRAAHARGDLGPAGAPVAVPDVVGRPEVAAMCPATSAEIRGWAALVLAHPDGGHILQSRSRGECKRRWGWERHSFSAVSAR